MPVVNQLGPPAKTQPASTQLNFRQMQGELSSWNPDMPPQMVARAIQNCYRRILDKRLWYGLLQKNQIVSPASVSGGSVALTLGSTSVIGTGTAFTNSMIGRQFRVGFSYPIYTIVAPPVGNPPMDATHLSLDIPWGGANYSSVGYQIFQSIYALGSIKMLLAMVNQQQGYRLRLHLDHPDVLNTYDTWRTQTGWTYMATMAPTSNDGQVQVELYPAPTFQQAFPFLAYYQPADFVADGDFPVPLVRSDVIVLGSISDALLYKGKNSKYYDAATAKQKRDEFREELESMALMDNNAFQKDLIWEFGKYPLTQYGADFAQSHEFSDAGW